MRFSPDFGVCLTTHPPRCVTPREMVMTSQPSPISFRRNSVTSPNRSAPQADSKTRALNRCGSIAFGNGFQFVYRKQNRFPFAIRGHGPLDLTGILDQ